MTELSSLMSSPSSALASLFASWLSSSMLKTSIVHEIVGVVIFFGCDRSGAAPNEDISHHIKLLSSELFSSSVWSRRTRTKGCSGLFADFLLLCGPNRQSTVQTPQRKRRELGRESVVWAAASGRRQTGRPNAHKLLRQVTVHGIRANGRIATGLSSSSGAARRASAPKRKARPVEGGRYMVPRSCHVSASIQNLHDMERALDFWS